MSNSIIEQLEREHRGAKTKMILGIVFSAVASFISALACFLYPLFIFALPFYGVGIPFLVTGIINTIKTNIKISNAKKAAEEEASNYTFD